MRIEQRAGQVAWRGVQMAVAAAGLPPEQRQGAALYLLVTACNLPGALAAQVAGCTRQNVSKMLGKVEDRREDPAYDAALAAIEQQLMGDP